MLLTFLRSSQHYNLDKVCLSIDQGCNIMNLFGEISVGKIKWCASTFQAYEICMRKNLLREQVFVLGRMGNSKKALAVIINKLEDIEEVMMYFFCLLKLLDSSFQRRRLCMNKTVLLNAGRWICDHATWWWTVGGID